MSSVALISPAELRRDLDGGREVVLLDVREDGERAYCSIAAPAGFVDLHIPMNQIPSRFEEVRTLGIPVVVYCHHGVRSMAVAQWLASRGVVGLANLEGGIDAWSTTVDRAVRRY